MVTVNEKEITMANYSVDLTPALRNLGTEGSLDTSIDANGNSIQRTFHGLLVVNGTDRKMVGKLADGGSFDDVIAEVGDLPNIVS